MFLLVDTNHSIIAKLLVAAPTTQPDFNTSYSDRNGTPPITWTEGANDGTLNDTSEVTIVAAPSAGNIRYVRNIQVQNPNTSQITVIFLLANGASRRVIRQIDVIAKGTAEWDAQSGWLTATTQTIVNGLTSGIVTSGLIGNAAVTSGNIASGAVGQFQLSSGAVTSGQIASGQVGQFALASGAITSGDIGNAAIVSGSFASGQISTNAIASGSAVSFSDNVMDDDRDGVVLTGELISGVKAVAFNSSGALVVAMVNVPTRLPPIGIVTANVASGQVATVNQYGRIYNTAFNFSGSLGNPVYLGASGALTTVPFGFTQSSGTISGSFSDYRMGTACSVSGLILNTDAAMYGKDIQFVEDTGQSTTTSASFVDKIILVTPALTGLYQVDFACDIGNSSKTGETILQFINTTDNTIYYVGHYTPASAGNNNTVTGFEQVAFTGVAKTFKIQFNAVASTAQIKNARIRLRRVG